MIDPAPLGSGPIYWFANWPIADVPLTGSAVYTIWDREGVFVYVCDRLVLPGLHNRLGEIADGSLSLDSETRSFIRAHLGFRWLAVPTPADALALEMSLQRGQWEHGRPRLNPIVSRPAGKAREG